jgi:hypothetical protein
MPLDFQQSSAMTGADVYCTADVADNWGGEAGDTLEVLSVTSELCIGVGAALGAETGGLAWVPAALAEGALVLKPKEHKRFPDYRPFGFGTYWGQAGTLYVDGDKTSTTAPYPLTNTDSTNLWTMRISSLWQGYVRSYKEIDYWGSTGYLAQEFAPIDTISPGTVDVVMKFTKAQSRPAPGS